MLTCAVVAARNRAPLRSHKDTYVETEKWKATKKGDRSGPATL